MTIQELKKQIETESLTDRPIIFKDPTDGFVSRQYIQEISRIRKLKIEYLDSLEGKLADTGSIFVDFTTKTDRVLGVLKSEVYLWGASGFDRLTDVIVVVSKFSDKAVEKALDEFIVKVPKLEDWMIKDYVYSTALGVDSKDLDKMLTLCGTNYLRLQNELDKIMLFSEAERKYLVPSMFQDCAFEDLSSYNIFNVTNALTARNIEALKNVYKELDRVDVSEFALLSILLKNFKNMIMVQTVANPTPESTGLDSKTLYAVKRIPKVFTADQLVRIYLMLLDIDRQIKTGELPADLAIDYMVLKIMST